MEIFNVRLFICERFFIVSVFNKVALVVTTVWISFSLQKSIISNRPSRKNGSPPEISSRKGPSQFFNFLKLSIHWVVSNSSTFLHFHISQCRHFKLHL